jgi:murein DD-endopeptidase MepM/ murein hydrolase activator NlpD
MIALCCAAIFACTPAPIYRKDSKEAPAEEPGKVKGDKKDYTDVDIVLRHPLGKSVTGKINSPFGIRTHPVYGTKEFHQGVDFEADTGDEVYAAAAGRVIYAGRQKGYGKVVIVDHGKGITSVYAHLGGTDVRKGENVETGRLLGRVGVSGNATGSHLHFELRVTGEAVNPLDFMEIR